MGRAGNYCSLFQASGQPIVNGEFALNVRQAGSLPESWLKTKLVCSRSHRQSGRLSYDFDFASGIMNRSTPNRAPGLCAGFSQFQTTSAILRLTFLPFNFSVPRGFSMNPSSNACMVFSLMTICPGRARLSNRAAMLMVSPMAV